ncbi:NADPH-dependent F420 reductase [Umezawaea sp.]|uniref:NADPH-dependent F420 reductase n=1 Tax=Umezawaea sp. TaxID=1955258 RepID=UPI0039C9CBDA
MKIGIIGAGNIGGALTRRLTALGHDVSVANSRGPETLADLAAETGATPVPLTEAARGAEVVIVTIPQGKVPSLPKGLLDEAAEGVAVIDTGNYYPQRDGRIEEIENGVTESRWVANQLGHPVVKVFNGIQALHLRDKGVPAGTPGRIALPVAGDDPAAKATVLRLVEELGFHAHDAGSIDESWRQQPGSPSYGADASPEKLPELLAQASPDRTPEFTA